MQLPAEITTDDGAKIWMEGQGHAIVPEGDKPSQWRVGGAFRFRTDDKRYS